MLQILIIDSPNLGDNIQNAFILAKLFVALAQRMYVEEEKFLQNM